MTEKKIHQVTDDEWMELISTSFPSSRRTTDNFLPKEKMRTCSEILHFAAIITSVKFNICDA